MDSPRNLASFAVFLLLWLVMSLVLLDNSAPVSAQSELRYDFESGTQGWELQPGIWSRALSPEGGYALRGAGHGFARFTAHGGNVSSLRFRFRLENFQTRLHANVLESFATGHTRYFVSFGSEGVAISRQQGGSFQDLGSGFVEIAPDVFYEAQIMVGGGSVDVFLDGEGVVGVDDPKPPPPGYVSFESLVESVVYVDDVEVRLGPESAPHPRAPRPLLSIPPGPDVGPFVDGTHKGPISLTGNDLLILSQGRYMVTEGNIRLTGNARLRIEQGAVLVVDRGSSPLIHWGVDLIESSALEVDGGNIVPQGALVRIHAFGESSVTIRNAKPSIHFIDTGDDAKVSILNSRFVTDIGGSIQISGRASVDIQDSQVGAIGLFIPAGSVFKAVGLRPSTFSAFDLQRDLTLSGIDYNLRMRNVELVPDRLGEGPYERGWVIFADETAKVDINDSILRKLVIEFFGLGPELAVSGLRLNQPTDLKIGSVVMQDVTVTGQWGFFIHGTRRATFDNSDALWFFLYDKAEVLLHNSTMNEFDPRQYEGTLTFEDARMKIAGEIIEGNDFIMQGTVEIDPNMRNSLSWSQSSVTRRFPISVMDVAGAPVPGASIRLTRESKVVAATTDQTGKALVELRFTDQDYLEPWQLTTSERASSLNVDFFTSTPIVVRLADANLTTVTTKQQTAAVSTRSTTTYGTTATKTTAATSSSSSLSQHIPREDKTFDVIPGGIVGFGVIVVIIILAGVAVLLLRKKEEDTSTQRPTQGRSFLWEYLK